jgi:hypothetical protein
MIAIMVHSNHADMMRAGMKAGVDSAVDTVMPNGTERKKEEGSTDLTVMVMDHRNRDGMTPVSKGPGEGRRVVAVISMNSVARNDMTIMDLRDADLVVTVDLVTMNQINHMKEVSGKMKVRTDHRVVAGVTKVGVQDMRVAATIPVRDVRGKAAMKMEGTTARIVSPMVADGIRVTISLDKARASIT